MSDTKKDILEDLVENFDKIMNEPADPERDNTPIFHGGVLVGCRQDLIDGKLDPMDRDAWKP